jgi:oligoribonuclease NrnB/cAMP/cGMP phosphodiesterase (DHH superfamily)
MEDKNRLLRLYILIIFFEIRVNRNIINAIYTVDGDYIEEKINFFLGNDLNEETLEKIKQFYKDSFFSSESFNELLEDIGDDEFYKIRSDDFTRTNIVGLHPVMSNKILKMIKSYLKSSYFKQKYRELRLNRITNRNKIIK